MRIEGWEKIARAHIEEAANKEFEWGAVDCLLFACDLAFRMTGKDPAESVRGQYTNEDEARQIALSLNKTPDLIMDEYFPRIAMNFARRGDIVYRRTDTGFNFGIVWDGKAAFKTAGKGITIERMEGLTAWAVD